MAFRSIPESAQYVVWLIRVRFLVIISILIIIIAAQSLGMQFRFLPLYLLLVFSLVYNTIFYYIGTKSPAYSGKKAFNYTRICLDLLIITIMVHFSGGVESPFNILYFADLATIALFFGSFMGILMSGYAIILYSTNSLLEAIKVLPHYQIAILPSIIYSDPGYFLLKSFSLFFIAVALIYVMSYLSLKIGEKQKEIEKLSSDKMNFMNMVAHELRSPLTSIQEYASLMLEGLTGQLLEEQKKAMSIIHKQSMRINNMVNDLLDLAHVESPTANYKKDQVSMHSLINNALAEMDCQLKQNKIILETHIPKDFLSVLGNDSDLLEVLINILSNAIKFSPIGGKIDLFVEKRDKEIIVSIKDEGFGIARNDLPHIFEKFYRTSLKKEASKYKGTGLGLALSKSIIEKHDGRIWAESDGPGNGATISFTLPIK